jgi:multiphosphoryl transfer protein
MKLLAPLAGWASPLEEAPDPVFAQRMLGDGLAIDPTSDVLHAPCDGEVIAFAASKHAITLAAAGAEILMHVGIDTVGLRGEGFEALVGLHARVRAGDPLLRFDLDFLARRAKSLLTPIIVTDGRHRIARRHQDAPVAVGEFLMELEAAGPVAANELSPSASTSAPARRARVGFAHGIHARPAALVAACAKGFDASVSIGRDGRTANARSVVALMSLGVQRGDEISIQASGPDAAAAAAALEALIARVEPVRAPEAAPKPVAPGPAPAGTVRGVIACRGLAIGPAARLARPELSVSEAGAGSALETEALDRARGSVAARLRRLSESTLAAQRDIMLAHVEFLDDLELVSAARALIAQGKSAGFAWRRAVREQMQALEALGDARMAERVDDLKDLETSVLLALDGGAHDSDAMPLPAGAILLARDLLPSQLATLDASKVAGICLAEGGPTSHVAILAAAMGVPTLVAAGAGVLGIAGGTPLVLDADAGILHVDPEPSQLAQAQSRLASRRERQARERAAAQRECRTADGTRIELFANVGSAIEAEAAVANGAEGCGLLRTEFLFLDRHTPPAEAEQTQEYQRIVDAFDGRPVVLRTLDAGGDKPIPYLPLPREPNPALGLRGVRTSLWRPDLLRAQLRALLAVRPAGRCRVLLPMVVSAAEVRTVRGLLDELRNELAIGDALQVGAMIETPAAAITADHIAEVADFLSIGTNDLTQYTLAMDRGHPELAGQLDALHPAVLRLIASAVRAGAARGRTVAVCGGLAGEPLAAPILIGLGVTELSVVPAAVPQMKALIATLTMDACREVARAALEAPNADAVRASVRSLLPERVLA